MAKKDKKAEESVEEVVEEVVEEKKENLEYEVRREPSGKLVHVYKDGTVATAHE